MNPVQEQSGTTPTANLLTGPGVDEVFTRTDSAGARNFLADALGSTLGLTDSTGTLQTQYTYEPFGNASVSGSTNANSYQFTGRENDGTGLYFYRSRYYSANLQRFISEDPIGFNGGMNFYRYVRNSPVNLVDPSGEVIGVAPGSGGGLSLPGMGPSGLPGAYLDFFTAMLYLKQSPYTDAIIQELEQSPDLYLVGVADYEYDARAGTFVKWNPHKGACTKRGRGAESPALLLLHELVHLWRSQRGLDSTDEEAVTQITNQVAAELGEATRVNYGDAEYARTPSPLPIPSSPMAGRNCGCK